MKPIDIKKFGMASSLLAGVLFVLTSVLASKMPKTILELVNSEEFENLFYSFQSTFMSLKMTAIFSNLCMMGIVLAFYLLVRDKRDLVILWGTVLALLGFGVGMFQSLMDMYVIPFTVSQLYEGTEVVRAFLLDLGVANPYMYVISAGFPGIWLFIVAFKHKINCYISRPLRVLSCVWGVVLLALVVVQVGALFSYIDTISLLGLVIAPIWAIWLGIFFYYRVKHLTRHPH